MEADQKRGPAAKATESEMHVSARCITHPEAMADVIAEGVTPEDFTEPTPSLVMGVAWDLFNRSELTSHEVVKSELQQRERFDEIGWEAWSDFVSFGWGEEDLPYHARRVRQAARLRRKDKAMREGSDGIRGSGSLRQREERADDAMERLVRERADQAEGVQHGEDMAAQLQERLEREEAEEIRLPTGIYSFDKRFRGVPRSRVTILGARTNHGKTVAADMIAISCARRFKRQAKEGEAPRQVVKFDLENSALEAQPRILAGIASTKDRSEKLTTQAIEDHLQNIQPMTGPQMERASAGNAELKELPLVLDTEGQGSPAYMRARLLAEKARAPIGLVIVDYMELVEGEGRGTVEQVKNAMRELHFIARDMEVPLILLSQTNRNQSSRDGGEPHLSDLSWGDALGKYSKMVIMPFNPFVHWDATGQQGPEPPKDAFDIWVRKNKGEQGLCSLKIDPDVPMLYDPNEPQEPWPSGGASSAPVPSGDTPF